MATDFFKRQMRVLHLEDNEKDHYFVAALLETNGLDCKFAVAKSRDEFAVALKRAEYDLIISDFSLPSYDGLSALSLARELSPETPFIFFSGTIGEEIAVDSLKNGATDYVLKQRPNRLVAAVRRALSNVAERKRLQRVERALQQSEERFRIVNRVTNDVIWEWDVQKNEVSFNENFQIAFGYPDENSIASEQWFGLIHPDDKNRVVSGLSALLASGGRVWWSEHRVRRANDSYAHVFDRASIIYDSGGKPIKMVGVTIDMSGRKEAEEKIREQAELLDKAQDAIIVCTLERNILFWNQGAERIYGWSADEVIGKNIRRLLFHGNPPPQIQEATKNLEEHGEWIGELQEFTKNGSTITVQARSTMIRDAQNQPKSLLIINTDITERKKLEEQFLRAQRLESLGTLVSGIAHDLNNALVPIIVGVDILKMQSLSHDAESMVRTMEMSARRGAEMVKQMLTFARGGHSAKTLMQIEQLVKEMGKIISGTFPKNVTCRTQVDNNLWPVSAFNTQLYQVLMNLCINARDAMPQGGKLTIAAKNRSLDKAEAASLRDARPGNYLCISVADTGTGIAPENLEKLFQPFFTTKIPGKGTGLGLSTSQTIVKNHGGFMSVATELGRGTEFKIYLPAETGVAAAPVTDVKPLLPAGKGEYILIVDDEESVLAIVRNALENYGYNVLTACGGLEATTQFAEKRDLVNLVITDLAMPFMDGRVTIAAIRKIRPDVKFIIASGSEGEMETVKQQTKSHAFIIKPFTTEALLKTVHEVLAPAK